VNHPDREATDDQYKNKALPKGSRHHPKLPTTTMARAACFDCTDASVAQAEESLDDYSLFVKMDNRHLRRFLTTTDYQATGIARIKSSYLAKSPFVRSCCAEDAPAMSASTTRSRLSAASNSTAWRKPSSPPSPLWNAPIRQPHSKANSYSAREAEQQRLYFFPPQSPIAAYIQRRIGQTCSRDAR
jgi:hypothetical protein